MKHDKLIEKIIFKEGLISCNLISTGQSNKLKFFGKARNEDVYYYEVIETNKTNNILLFDSFEKPDLINVLNLGIFWIHKFNILPKNAIRIDKLFSTCSIDDTALTNIIRKIMHCISEVHDKNICFTDNHEYRTLLSNVKSYNQEFRDLLRLLKGDSPFSIIHGDFHLKNMFFVDEKIYLLDYEYSVYESVFIDYIKLETSILIHLNRSDCIRHFETNEYSKYLVPFKFLKSNNNLINLVRNYAYDKLNIMTYDLFYKTYIVYLYYYFVRFLINESNSIRNKMFVKTIVKDIHQLTSAW